MNIDGEAKPSPHIGRHSRKTIKTCVDVKVYNCSDLSNIQTTFFYFDFTKMKRKVLIGAIILFTLYFISYIWLRQTHIEVWEKDGKPYVIFPEKKILYYFFRPLSVIDKQVTAIDFHIGQHR